MKRDFELVRKILTCIEESEGVGHQVNVDIDGYTEDQIMYHLMLLSQADLIFATDVPMQHKIYIMARGLTWEGHEFLDSIKNETVWNKTQQAVKDKGGSVSFEILKIMATGYAKTLFGV
jgi:hypothetical protein